MENKLIFSYRHPDLHIVGNTRAGIVVVILRAKLGLIVEVTSVGNVPDKIFLTHIFYTYLTLR